MGFWGVFDSMCGFLCASSFFFWVFSVRFIVCADRIFLLHAGTLYVLVLLAPWLLCARAGSQCVVDIADMRHAHGSILQDSSDESSDCKAS